VDDDEIISAGLAESIVHPRRLLMENLFDYIVELMKTGETAAFAVVIRTEGSSPRRVGAKMIIMNDGTTAGTLGGGDLEKKVIEEAMNVIKQGRPKIASFTLDIEEGKLDMMCGGKLDIYIEPILPEAKLIIFGAGHISRSIAPLMRGAGFQVSVVEDSPDLLQKDKFPETQDLILTDMEQFARDLPPDSQTYIVLLSRGFSRDKAILSQLIQKDFKYIGMIGSQRKIRTMEEELEKQGVPREAFSKLHAPVGLDIGAETPEEIAISIAAEIIAAKKGKLAFCKKGI
jgi:xanthine dehydrogenase accessory factor